MLDHLIIRVKQSDRAFFSCELKSELTGSAAEVEYVSSRAGGQDSLGERDFLPGRGK